MRHVPPSRGSFEGKGVHALTPTPSLRRRARRCGPQVPVRRRPDRSQRGGRARSTRLRQHSLPGSPAKAPAASDGASAGSRRVSLRWWRPRGGADRSPWSCSALGGGGSRWGRYLDRQPTSAPCGCRSTPSSRRARSLRPGLDWGGPSRSCACWRSSTSTRSVAATHRAAGVVGAARRRLCVFQARDASRPTCASLSASRSRALAFCALVSLAVRGGAGPRLRVTLPERASWRARLGARARLLLPPLSNLPRKPAPPPESNCTSPRVPTAAAHAESLWRVFDDARRRDRPAAWSGIARLVTAPAAPASSSCLPDGGPPTCTHCARARAPSHRQRRPAVVPAI